MSGFDGNGNFFFTYNWVNDAQNGIPITASRMDSQFNDAVGGFDLCITRDGQGAATGLIPFSAGITLGGGSTLVVYQAQQTWTPVDASGAGLVFTINGAGYSSIGNMDFIWGDITFPVTSDTSDVTIGGLPRTIQNIPNVGGSFGLSGVGGGTDFCFLVPNTKTFQAYNNASSNRPNSQYSNSRIRFQFTCPT